jgi:hypothetical protein
MPNWYHTTITLTGPESALTRFKTAHFRHEPDDDYLDFNTVIPMPEVIKGTEASSVVDDGLYLLGRLDLVQFTPSLDFPWVKEAGITTEEQLKAELLKRCPDCIEKAKKAIAVHEATGYTDWYQWSCDNWGTKWNSQRLHVLADTPDTLQFSLATAWGPPMPVIKRLVQLYPELAFNAEGVDEGDYYEHVYNLLPRADAPAEITT